MNLNFCPIAMSKVAEKVKSLSYSQITLRPQAPQGKSDENSPNTSTLLTVPMQRSFVESIRVAL